MLPPRSATIAPELGTRALTTMDGEDTRAWAAFFAGSARGKIYADPEVCCGDDVPPLSHDLHMSAHLPVAYARRLDTPRRDDLHNSTHRDVAYLGLTLLVWHPLKMIPSETGQPADGSIFEVADSVGLVKTARSRAI
jgi:hypothetical protein